MGRNVYADLGFNDDRAAEMALRVAIAVQIHRVIKDRQLSQDDAKKLFGVPQPTISKITRLRLSGLSIALLLRMLFKAGLSFEIGSDGTSQTIRASVESKPRSAASLIRDWRPVEQVSPGIVKVDAARLNDPGTDDQPEHFQREWFVGSVIRN
jgi:predicted XRE-type DNA-binding protein